MHLISNVAYEDATALDRLRIYGFQLNYYLLSDICIMIVVVVVVVNDDCV